MTTKEKTNILCFLLSIKKDKKFYKTHKGEIDFYIELLKDDISEKTPSLSGHSLKSLIVWLADLASKYFNSP